MKTKLRRCPCCGSKAELKIVLVPNTVTDKYELYAFAKCTFCGLQIVVGKENYLRKYDCFANQASTSWNLSSSDPQLDKETLLHSCPFCGSQAKIIFTKEEDMAAIRCSNKECGAHILGDSLEEVRSLWNKRHK